MRVYLVLGLGLMAACMAAYLAPTSAVGDAPSSIAHQRTDVAAAVLTLAWLSIAASIVGVSALGLALAAVAAAVALATQPLIADNPNLGELAFLLHLAAPAVAFAFGGIRFALARVGHSNSTEDTAQADTVDSTWPEPAVDAPAAPEPAPTEEAAAPAASLDLFRRDGQPARKVDRAAPATWPPDDRERLRFLEGRLAEAGSPQQSFAILDEIAGVFPEYAPARLKLAAHLMGADRYEDAYKHLEVALASAPDNAGVRRTAARCASVLDEWGAAAGHWRKVIDISGPQAAAVTALVSALGKAGEVDEALRVFAEYGPTWPNDVKLIAAAARAAYTDRRFDDATALWTRALELDGRQADFAFQLVRCLTTLDRPREALDVILSATPKDEPADSRSMSVLMNNTPNLDHDFALETLKTVPAATEEPWVKYVGRCLLADAFDDAEEALAAARAANLAKETTAGCEALVRHARRKAGLDAPPETSAAGAKDAATAEGARSNAAEMLIHAEALERDGAWQAALGVYKDYEREHGAGIDLTLRVSNVLRQLERRRDAMDLIDAANEAFGGVAALWLEKAICAEAIGDATMQEDAYQRALAAEPDCPPAWIGLIRLHLTNQRVDAASALLRQALETGVEPNQILGENDIRSLHERAVGAVRP